jgi:hypothetical protein
MIMADVTLSQVRALMQFGGKDPALRSTASASMIRLQEEGVTALCNILRHKPFAYLADEVGLGKTMQALGVVGCYRARHPAARILIITPRQSIQGSWLTEYKRFVANIWCGKDMPEELEEHDRLGDWLHTLPGEPTVSLLRLPSFMRPVRASGAGTRAWRAAIAALNLEHIDTFSQQPPAASGEGSSFDFNKAFAQQVNAWFRKRKLVFDLVVVDEAQCLRNPDNQSNTVLYQLLKGCAEKWLFLSATPAHSGVATLAAVLNHYPAHRQGGDLITKTMMSGTDRYVALQKLLSEYMVRRPRTYDVGNTTLTKHDYRRDRKDALALTCDTALGALSIGMVQRYLVQALAQNNNRFRTGYMASFESLDDSLRGRPIQSQKHRGAETDQPEEDASFEDWFADQYHRHPDAAAPDAGFVARISEDFKRSFQDMSLPHPKLDAVEEDLARAAFGVRGRDGDEVGGTKTLVFCRRISSVTALRTRLTRHYLEGIEARCRTYWKRPLDWKIGLTELPADGELDPDPEPDITAVTTRTDDGNVDNKLRIALQDKKWLHRFRATFDDGQRHALFFEYNWFERLCKEGKTKTEHACARVPAEIWAESYVHAGVSQDKGKGKRNRRRQARYLTWHCLDRHGREVFGLTQEQLVFWRTVLQHVFTDDIKERVHCDEPASGQANRDTTVLEFRSFWSHWEQYFTTPEYVLPGPSGTDEVEAILWRRIVMAVLAQYMRLSDVLVDLFCADRLHGAGQDTLDCFFTWLRSEDIDARRLLKVFVDWIAHYRLIFSSAIGETESPSKLASREDFEFLHMLDPVMGVTGGSGNHHRLIQQFNTPGLPYIVVGTDTLREGVNLHLFCKRVMHYGVAWTAGDLEQRIGRVDRYFSLIERDLQAAHADGQARPTLDIYYPHLKDTLERRQIENLFERKRESDAAVDSPLAAGIADAQELEVALDYRPPAPHLPIESLAGGLFQARRHLVPRDRREVDG